MTISLLDKFNMSSLPQSGNGYLEIPVGPGLYAIVCHENGYLEIPVGPGLYAIVCHENGMVYFGETNELARRTSEHYSRLNKGKASSCSGLQKDWKTFGKDKFSFFTIARGPQWANEEFRQDEELKLVQANAPVCYNIRSNPTTPTRIAYNAKPVVIDGVNYPSIKIAAYLTGLNYTLVYDRVNSRTSPTYYYKDKEVANLARSGRTRAKSVVIEGKTYASMSEAAKALKVERKKIDDLCKNVNRDDCYFKKEDDKNRGKVRKEIK